MTGTDRAGTASTIPPASEIPALESVTVPGSRTRLWASVGAEWLGLANLWLVLGSSVVMQWAWADRPGGWVLGAPESWLRAAALSGALVVLLAALGGRVRWPAWVLAGLLGIWLGSGALSAWVLSGEPDTRSLLMAVAGGGLVLGAAAARTTWSGWSIYLIGFAYVYLHLAVLWKNYYSLGGEFPLVNRWLFEYPGGYTLSVPSVPEWANYPSGLIDRARALLSLKQDATLLLPSGVALPTYRYQGLTTNPNLTGMFMAPLVAFAIPFAAGRWHPTGWRGRAVVYPARVALAAAVVVPAVYLLDLLDARAALLGVIAGAAVMLVPIGWARNRWAASVAALALPVLIMAPVVHTLRWGGPSYSGRDCVWDTVIPLIRATPSWGLGPPGGFEASCGPVSVRFAHAHNELLQAWSLGGLVGICAAVLALGFLVWFAVRFSDRDIRALVAVLTCSAVVMAVEVLTPSVGYTVHLGIAALAVVAGRSLALMGDREGGPPADPEDDGLIVADPDSAGELSGPARSDRSSSEIPPAG